mmetsp:Transcript_124/g.452  ORF Transcript_124/g.452 Transcript_124/m.452 type:complete len:287 (+) Transcript_124:225-1085(+)
MRASAKPGWRCATPRRWMLSSAGARLWRRSRRSWPRQAAAVTRARPPRSRSPSCTSRAGTSAPRPNAACARCARTRAVSARRKTARTPSTSLAGFPSTRTITRPRTRCGRGGRAHCPTARPSTARRASEQCGTPTFRRRSAPLPLPRLRMQSLRRVQARRRRRSWGSVKEAGRQRRQPRGSAWRATLRRRRDFSGAHPQAACARSTARSTWRALACMHIVCTARPRSRSSTRMHSGASSSSVRATRCSRVWSAPPWSSKSRGTSNASAAASGAPSVAQACGPPTSP